MTPIKYKTICEIIKSFSVSDEEALTACLLLEARARTLDYSFDEYINRYHPHGIAQRDEFLGEQFEGYVEFLKDDAQAVLRAGKGADFSTFAHECAHVFRRQLVGELREQAEKVFGVENGIWTVEKEEQFANGLERYIRQRHRRDDTRGNVYNKGKEFVDTVYRGMDILVDIDPKMEAVYERLFNDRKNIFNQYEYEKTLKQVSQGIIPESSHISLGMTPNIYEELGFERLPMAITRNHLYSTLRENGTLESVNYHDLGEDILKQLPQQLKKPICIVQSPNDESELISIIGLKDKEGKTIIVPIAQNRKGNFNNTEIDINLVKTVFGKNGFENWLKTAVDDDRLLYIDKRNRTSSVGQLPHTSRAVPYLPPGYISTDLLQDVFGFLPDNITRYREAVKQKFPERFNASGERILYKTRDNDKDQLSLEFTQEIKIPHPNISENFIQNFTAIAEEFKDDKIEAARYLLRDMPKEDRETALTAMREAGCTDRESYHKYLNELLTNKANSLVDRVMTEDFETLEQYVDKNISRTEFRRSMAEKGYSAKDLVEIEAFAETLEPSAKVRDFEITDFFHETDKDDRTGELSVPKIIDYLNYFNENKSSFNSVNWHDIKNVIKDIAYSINSVTLDFTYKNAVINADPDLAKLECKKALNNYMNNTVINNNMELYKQYVDNPNFNYYLSETVFLISNPFVKELHKREQTQTMARKPQEAVSKVTEAISLEENNSAQDNIQTFRPYGAWTDFNSRLSANEREKYNKEALALMETAKENPLSEDDRAVLRRYSGFGGIAADNERGVLYDYYTSPPVTKLTYDLLKKSGDFFIGDTVLEPSCGTGVFFDNAPKDMGLQFTGVELDKRTADIAEAIHLDKHNVYIYKQSFEAFNLSEKAKELGEFDHVIGNAPFGERTASLAALDMPEEKSLDNYFVTRSIDKLKEGGTMALIVAPGVLENKTNTDFRLSLCKKAQFIGAVKLPNRSFNHTHTQVMPDILLFRKYPEDIIQRLSALDDYKFKTFSGFYNHDFIDGDYFDRFPEHIAGELSEGTGQWGNDEIKGDITPELLGKILGDFTPAQPVHENEFERVRQMYPLPKVKKETKNTINLSDEELAAVQDGSLRQGVVKITGNNVYILSDKHLWTLASEKITLANKITDIKDITASVSMIREGMIAEIKKETLQQLQFKCRTQLLEYIGKYGHLPADDPEIKSFTKNNPAVQGIYEAFLGTDDPILFQTNIYRKDIEAVDGHDKAITALLAMREQMKDATGETIQEMFPNHGSALVADMLEHKDIFLTTDGVFQLREDFIAGDAWAKIDELKITADNQLNSPLKEKLLYGAAELEKAVGWTPIEDADYTPRSSWIPQEIIRDWVTSNEGLGSHNLLELAKNDEGKWGKTLYIGKPVPEWKEANDPIVYYLNGQKQRSSYYNTDVFNKEHDDLFRSYISNHQAYREILENEFNRKFKTHIIAPVKTYPVNIEGWQLPVNKSNNGRGKEIKPHQWQSIHHLYRNQCGISALGTGFGKTVTAIGLMSLLRQEGKSHRVFLQVPNNKVKDWIEEIKDVMPGLKIASIDPEEAGYSSRDKRYAKYQAMARSDADIIIMPESSASEIQLSPENDAKVTQKVASLYKLEKADRSKRTQQLAELKGEYKAQSGKTNITVSFEDFGCDAIFVDEAHRYKNLFSSTLSRETGMNDGRQSVKAMSLFKKTEYIREQTGNKNVFLLTATPLTNSPLEYYNMMQFIAPQELHRVGIHTIDGFIKEFAHIEYGWLYDWSNGQAKQGNILTGFKNLPTLQNLFFMYTDLQNNPEAVCLEKPLAENNPHIIPLDKKQSEVIKAISKELDRYKSLDAQQREARYPGQNFLTFYSKLRTASLDLELFDPQKYKNWENPKLAELAKTAYANYEKTKSGQVIFCDRVFSSDASFNIHEKTKAELVKQGYKEKDIVIVNGFTKSGGKASDSAIEKEVSKAVADYNAGKYKVIIGSTACIGEGLNLQKNSGAVHHFDIPFRPSDFIQRNGRVDRQGNEQGKVSLHTYMSAGTIDNYSVNLVQRKANWIDQLLRTKSEVFTNPNDDNSVDVDELLLSLTEEFGDKDAALKRREALEIQKNEKIKEAQTLQMKASLAKLSLAKSALQPLKEGTAEYNKRTAQISNLEGALKNNPVFTKQNFLGTKEPFLYNADNNEIYRKGNVIVSDRNTFIINSFDFKKQKLHCTELLSEEALKRKEGQHYHTGYKKHGEYDPSLTVSLAELSGNKSRKYSYPDNEQLHHFEKPSKETIETLKHLDSKSFYNLPEEQKECNYNLHIEVIAERYNAYKPVVFYINKKGALEVQSDVSGYELKEKIFLNPFNDNDYKTILDHLDNNNIEYSKYSKDNILEELEITVPDLFNPLKDAINKCEQREEEKIKELKKKLVEKMATDVIVNNGNGLSEKIAADAVTYTPAGYRRASVRR